MPLRRLNGQRRALACTFVLTILLNGLRYYYYYYRGDIGLISAGSDPLSEWTLEGRWMGGHEGVVRSVLWKEWVSALGRLGRVVLALTPVLCYRGDV